MDNETLAALALAALIAFNIGSDEEQARAERAGVPQWMQARSWSCSTDTECLEECLANLPAGRDATDCGDGGPR
jgi:succinate dehydrogenase/fumarate reductase-like Fe-S protein